VITWKNWREKSPNEALNLTIILTREFSRWPRILGGNVDAWHLVCSSCWSHHEPECLSSNIEAYESHFPILYQNTSRSWRRLIIASLSLPSAPFGNHACLRKERFERVTEVWGRLGHRERAHRRRFSQIQFFFFKLIFDGVLSKTRQAKQPRQGNDTCL
jgi:hypothetical protein